MRNCNCSNTLTAVTLINSDKTVHTVNLIMMCLKLGDFVSGSLSAEWLCGAAEPIAESTGPKCLSEILSIIIYCCARYGSSALQGASIIFYKALHKVHDNDSL